ncbi:MAG TPA: acyl-CoA dehydrogenase family protein [Thermomonospora sp.]|nr:acyl-CoA dehydrogenase family protein [Thermomonospora sp.]
MTDRRADPLAEVEAIMAQVAAHEDGEFPREIFTRLMATGLARLVLADEPDLRKFCTAVERIAYDWLALAESVHLQTLAACTVARFASGEVRAEYLDDLADGRAIGANCVSEEQAGSDMGAIALAAVRDGDVYRLTGRKTWVGHAPVANLLNVYARTSDAGLGGITCFLVDASAPGVRVAPPARKHAAAALPTADVTFEDVVVPATRVLGRRDRGARVAEELFTQGRIGLAACAVGLGQAAVDRAVAYARRRVQFGAPVIRNQGVSFLLADMATRVQAARQLLYRACAEVAGGGADALLLSAQAKLFATEAAMRVTTDAVQVLGSAAYLPGEPVERWMREAKLLQIIQGTNQIQRQAIAARL